MSIASQLQQLAEDIAIVSEVKENLRLAIIEKGVELDKSVHYSAYPAAVTSIETGSSGIPEDTVNETLDIIAGVTLSGGYIEKVSNIVTSIEDIRQAIIAKGQDIPTNTPLSGYADKIAAIQGSTPEPVGDIPVYFFDQATGEIFNTQYVESGGFATPPEAPVHDLLTFTGWKGSMVNVTEPRYIAAMYNVTDFRYAYLFISVPANSLSINLDVKKTTGARVYVNWGFGSEEFFETTSTGGGTSKTYPAAGDYMITIRTEANSSGQFGFGGQCFAGNSTALRKAYLPAGCILGASNFLGCGKLKSIVISNGTPFLTEKIFQNCASLRFVALPDSMTYNSSNVPSANYWFTSCTTLEAALLSDIITYTQYTFQGCGALQYVLMPTQLRQAPFMFYGCVKFNQHLVMPNLMTEISMRCLSNCYALQYVEFGSSITSIVTYALMGCYALTAFVIRRTTPPSIDTSAFFETSPGLKIYVPDANVAAYKAATGWISLASQIYPISQLPA